LREVAAFLAKDASLERVVLVCFGPEALAAYRAAVSGL
jgi:O-acetyl-ADP-ribose deacetylase (regulator of RNase III)